jgi:hypothetical protein
MRHDYEFPPDWDAMDQQAKSDWMTQDRCRRRALAQQTAYAHHARQTAEREARKIGARSHTAPVKR